MAAGTQDSETIVVAFESQLYSKKDRERLHEELKSRIEQGGISRIVLDFTRARWFGAPILNELVVLEQILKKRKGELVLVGSQKIERMLYAARVDRVKLFANVQTALASLGHPVCAAA